MSSSYYKGLIDKCDEISKQLSTVVIPAIESTEDIVNTGNNYMKELIISGKPMDDGKLEVLKSNLSKVRENINTIAAEVTTRRAEYVEKYNEALAAEKEISV